METPKYTVLFNQNSSDNIISRNRSFYYDLSKAQEKYDILHNMDELKEMGEFLFAPTLRPYNAAVDHIHLIG